MDIVQTISKMFKWQPTAEMYGQCQVEFNGPVIDESENQRVGALEEAKTFKAEKTK